MNKLRSLTSRDQPRPFIVHLNSNIQHEVILQSKDSIGFVIGAIERKLNISIDDKKYQLYTSDNQQVNLNAMAKQIKQNEFWLKPEYDISKENANKVFGVDLSTITDRNPITKLPLVLHKSFEFLYKERSIRTVGLFRLSGNQAEIDRYKRLFESPASKDIDFPASIDPNIVGGVVKLYFKELPEPLLLKKNFQELVGIGEMPTETDRLKKLKDIIRALPAAHYEVLKYVMQYLVELTRLIEKNKITSNNMAIVFGPLWIRRAQSEEKESEREENQSKRRGLSSRIKNIYIKTIGAMIENYSFMFEASAPSQHLQQQQEEGDNVPPTLTEKQIKLKELLMNIANSRTQDEKAPPQSVATPNIVVRNIDSAIESHLPQPTKFDKSAFFSKLKEANQTSTKTPRTARVGTIKGPTPDTSLNLTGLLANSPRSPRREEPETQLTGGDSSSWNKIIKDLEDRLSAMTEQVEKLKSEKDQLTKESMQTRKELNKELDDYLEKHKLLRSEYDRAKSKWQMTEQEFKERIEKLEAEIRLLKKENLELKINSENASPSDDGSRDHLKRRSVRMSPRQDADKFKRASMRTIEKPVIQSDDEDSSDEDDRTDKFEDTPDKKRISVRNNNPNLFEDPNAAKSSSPAKAVPKKEDIYIEKCAACNKGITSGEEYLQAKGNTYHSSCFKCFGCQQSISGAFADRNGKFFCKACIEKMRQGVKFEQGSASDSVASSPKQLGENQCAKCFNEIPKSEKVKALSKSFHKGCFKCFQCDSIFENNKFFALDGNPVCLNCKRDSMKPK